MAATPDLADWVTARREDNRTLLFDLIGGYAIERVSTSLNLSICKRRAVLSVVLFLLCFFPQ